MKKKLENKISVLNDFNFYLNKCIEDWKYLNNPTSNKGIYQNLFKEDSAFLKETAKLLKEYCVNFNFNYDEFYKDLNNCSNLVKIKDKYIAIPVEMNLSSSTKNYENFQEEGVLEL